MRLPDNVEELHLIAEYHTACRTLRHMGWGGVVFGIINIALGITFTLTMHPINLILVLIGLFVLAAGIWCLALPGAEGAICNGIALILVGLWNLFVTVLNIAAGANPQVWWAIFGIILIAAGVQCFQKYARFSEALRHGVSREEMTMMDRLVKSILKANAKEDDDIILFQVRAFFGQKNWRGQLGQRVAFFVEQMTKEVLVADKDDMRVKPHGKVFLGKSLKASVRINDHKWEAQISQTSYDRYCDWQDRQDEDDRDRQPRTGIRPRDDRDEDSGTDFTEEKRPRRDRDSR
jgi:hypothetical protein